jgi:hypothetical protein
MRPSTSTLSTWRWSELIRQGVVVVAVAVGTIGCAAASSLVATSAYHKASVYGTSKAYVHMVPGEAFEPGVAVLAELEGVEITAIDETSHRCTAAQGNRVVTFRVFESGGGHSRLSILVGGGDDPDANQRLADSLIRSICRHLGVECG